MSTSLFVKEAPAACDLAPALMASSCTKHSGVKDTYRENHWNYYSASHEHHLSNHWQLDCSFDSLLRLTIKTWKLHINNPLQGEFNGNWWIPFTKGQHALWRVFLCNDIIIYLAFAMHVLIKILDEFPASNYIPLEKYWNFDSVYPHLFHKGLLGYKLTLVQVKAWCWRSKWLPELMMTKICDALKCHKASES